MFHRGIKHSHHAILLTGIIILPTVPVNSDIDSNYAKLDSPVESRVVKTGPIEWRCGGAVCNTANTTPTPNRGHCEALAVQVGVIIWFEIGGKPLAMTDLTRCNLAADTKRKQTISMQLLDADTARPIRDTAVDIHSDNGIRCVRAPCPTESRDWQGQTDADGWVHIPSAVFNQVTHLQAEGYGARNLMREAVLVEAGIWKVSLDPQGRLDNHERPLRLFDTRDRQPLSGIDIWITESRTCRPPDCRHYSFHGTTNDLGYVYYPLSAITKNSWIHARGYQPEPYHPGAVNYKVVLKPAQSGD